MTDEPEHEAVAEAPKRGRPRSNRIDLTNRERRRRSGPGVIPGLKLTVNEDELDRENYSYRFINDRPGRIRQMTEQDDWELVDDPRKQMSETNAHEGNRIAYHAGIGEGNAPMRTYLARKPKQWYDEDQREKQKPLDDIDHQIRRGSLTNNSPEAAAIAGKHGYVPEGSISIRDGRRK